MQLDVNQLQNESVRREVMSGMLLGKIESVLSFLEARNIPLSAEQRQIVKACKDIDTASRWVQRAAVISTADELFED